MGGHFDLEKKSQRIKELHNALNDVTIWSDHQKAKYLNSELVNLQKSVNQYSKLVNDIEEYLQLINLSNENESFDLIIKDLEKEVSDLEINLLLTGKYDDNDCFLEIHPGAGGTEACDWAAMLLRIYIMFCDRNNYTYEILDYQDGDEAGIKSVTIKILGFYPYGYFKSEHGVHRLVRISPFDSNKRRHTSFAAVSVFPVINNDTELIIKQNDIRIDVYKSSGKGGQGVNTTDSAVRITHLPTNIVVTCQNERSQIRNKEIAMNILQSKLELLIQEKQNISINELKNLNNINFGSQIRNYTLEPYKLVKDVRSGYETSNTDAVLDGDIIDFLKAYLRIKR